MNDIDELMSGLMPRVIETVADKNFPDRWVWYFVDGKQIGHVNEIDGGWGASLGDSRNSARLGVWLTKELADQALRDAL